MLVRPVAKVPRWCALKSTYFSCMRLHVLLTGVIYTVTYSIYRQTFSITVYQPCTSA